MSSKKILIDGYNLNLEAGTGVATYARNLSYRIHALGYDVDVVYGTRAAPREKLLREIAFFDSNVGRPNKYAAAWDYLQHAIRSPLYELARAVPITGNVITTTYASRLPYFDRLWNIPTLFDRSVRHFGLLKRLTNIDVPSRPDLVHWTYPLPIRARGAKNIYTIHDLVPLRLPYTTLDVKRRYYRIAKKLAARADHIVTVSEHSRRDIINLLNVPEDRVTNTYQSVEIPQKFAGKPDDVVKREVEGTLNVKYKGYFLFFGAIEPKKNVSRMIEAYLSSGVETPLLLVGKAAWKSDEELRMLNADVTRYLETIDRMTITRHRIQRIDYVPFSVLVSIIRGAKAVLFPSLYEGFGLPALEAMLLGTPVITSTESSMPEVVGDGALMVDPYDSRALAEAIRTVDSNDELRGELSAKGVKQAAKFSPEAYDRRLKSLYDRVIGSGA